MLCIALRKHPACLGSVQRASEMSACLGSVRLASEASGVPRKCPSCVSQTCGSFRLVYRLFGETLLIHSCHCFTAWHAMVILSLPLTWGGLSATFQVTDRGPTLQGDNIHEKTGSFQIKHVPYKMSAWASWPNPQFIKRTDVDNQKVMTSLDI